MIIGKLLLTPESGFVVTPRYVTDEDPPPILERLSCLGLSRLVDATVDVPSFVSSPHCDFGNFGSGSDPEDRDGNSTSYGAGFGCDGKGGTVGGSTDPVPRGNG